VLLSVMKSIEAIIPSPPGGEGPQTASELTQPSSKKAPKPKRRFQLT